MTFTTCFNHETIILQKRWVVAVVTATCLAFFAPPSASLAQSAQTAATQNMQLAAAAPVQSLVAAESFMPVSSSVDLDAADRALPDTPEPQVHASTAAPFDKTSPAGKTVAPRYAKDITPEETAYNPLSARDKIVLGARDLYSPLNFAAMISAAGLEQIQNGPPNYGTGGSAFGQRFGASAIRETAQDAFSDLIFHPIFRTDPRYYIEGTQYGFFHRTFYAASRVFVTRTDSGKNTINAALLSGYAGAAALNNTFYPQSNRNFTDNATGYGGSLGGAMVGFLVVEFSSDLLHIVHKDNKK